MVPPVTKGWMERDWERMKTVKTTQETEAAIIILLSDDEEDDAEKDGKRLQSAASVQRTKGGFRKEELETSPQASRTTDGHEKPCKTSKSGSEDFFSGLPSTILVHSRRDDATCSPHSTSPAHPRRFPLSLVGKCGDASSSVATSTTRTSTHITGSFDLFPTPEKTNGASTPATVPSPDISLATQETDHQLDLVKAGKRKQSGDEDDQEIPPVRTSPSDGGDCGVDFNVSPYDGLLPDDAPLGGGGTRRHQTSTSSPSPDAKRRRIVAAEDTVANTNDSPKRAASLPCTPSPPRPCHCRIFLLPLGKSMARARINILSKALTKKTGVTVLERFSKSTLPQLLPTHIVVDPHVSASSVAHALQFSTEVEMAETFAKYKIQTVKPEWVARSGFALEEPSLAHQWTGLQGVRSTNVTQQRKRGRAMSSVSGKPDDDQRRCAAVNQLEMEPTEKKHPSTGGSRKRNEGLSKTFDCLAKVHQSCPLNDLDEWRAYTFALIAGRVRNLPFEIVNQEDVLRRLSKIGGFGRSVMTKIREYLATGTLSKIAQLKSDPMRIAVKTMMAIWGIGRKTAIELVNNGYRTIADVRKDLALGKLSLTSHALIGVECYEDLMEKMDRREVEQIGDLVASTCREMFPGAMACTMGSFRRGKSHSGDVDVLITHPDFVRTTPRGAVAAIVRVLEHLGHVAHHLTELNHDPACAIGGDGSETTAAEGSGGQQQQQQQQRQERTLDVVAVERIKAYVADNCAPIHLSQSYMGVFWSPIHRRKRRRVDIKFYPYRERAFATLYFTGSGLFNRSMRLWAKRKQGITLNDHGMWPVSALPPSGSRSHRMDDLLRCDHQRIHAATEEEVFDRLRLEYRQPKDRDCFDAVCAKGTPKVADNDDDNDDIMVPTKQEMSEESVHSWVE